MQETIEKVKSFLEFEGGWYFGKGNKFKEEVIIKAIEIINSIPIDSDCFPGENGEVMISFYDNEWYYEFIIDPNLKIDFVSYKNDILFEYKENVDLNKIIDDYFSKLLFSVIDDLNEKVTKKIISKFEIIRNNNHAEIFITPIQSIDNIQFNLEASHGFNSSKTS